MFHSVRFCAHRFFVVGPLFWWSCSAFWELALVCLVFLVFSLLFLLFIVSFILWSFFCYVHTTANDFLCMAGIFLYGNSLDLYPMVPLTLLLSEAICLPLHYLCCLLLSFQTLITFLWKIKWLEFKPNCRQFSTKNKCIAHTCDRGDTHCNTPAVFINLGTSVTSFENWCDLSFYFTSLWAVQITFFCLYNSVYCTWTEHLKTSWFCNMRSCDNSLVFIIIVQWEVAGQKFGAVPFQKCNYCIVIVSRQSGIPHGNSESTSN